MAGYVSIPTETAQIKPPKVLTDADVTALLTKEFDLYKVSGTQVVIGQHEGYSVIADFPCSDVCPMNTIKIIRYNVEAFQCSITEGKVEELLTPTSISMGTKQYCVPEIIFGKQAK
jgi:hypothetical protein